MVKRVSRFLRGLLSRRDWVYLLSLLTPFVFYNLALKASTISIAWESVRLGDWGSLAYLGAHIYLMGSDVAFSLGYVLLWVGIFAAARRGPLRWTVVFLFHVITILIVIINTSAHQYFQKFGTTLDYEIIAFELPRIKERAQYGWFDVVPLSAWVLMGVALLYTALGPWLLTRFVSRWRGWPERPTSTRILYNFYFMSSLGLCSIALLFGSLSLLIGEDGPSSTGALARELSSKKLTQLSEKFSRSFLRDPFVNVVMTAGEAITSEEPAAVAVEPPPPASLVPTTASERRNVVLILLESTRAQYTTPYKEDLDTTPFLNELAKSSLLAEQAYTVMPTTSKANVAANCGIAPSTAEPVFGGVMEAAPGGIPTPCLPNLLRDQGYNTVFFMSTSKNFENFEDLQKNLGYESFYSEESMPEKDFDFKDDRMLKPSEEWLGNQKELGKPFLATYLTYDTHYPYTLPDSYEQERFADDEVLNRYLNTLRYQDQWLKNLFEQYKRLGLYEDTVFVLVGDHGEAFGEHGLSIHGNFLYEEGLSIPLIIHDPKRLANGNRVKDPVNQLDILPTVSELLGYQIEGGAYQGNSLLRPLPKDRTIFFSCFMEKKCIASLRGNIKYVHHFGNRSDEVFDLSVDPLEKHNLAEEGGKDLQERRNELLAWRSKIANFYRTNYGLEGSEGQ